MAMAGTIKEEQVLTAFIKVYGELAAGQMVLSRLLVVMALQHDDPLFWLERFVDRAKRHPAIPMPDIGAGDDPRGAIEAAAVESVRSLLAGITVADQPGEIA